MRQAISQQHPAVVLRSTYRQLRALLAVALVALVALSTAVVILATEEDGSSTGSISSASAPASRPGGGPDESGVAAAIGKGEPTQPAARPDESRIAGEIDTGAEPTVPEAFQDRRFGGHRSN
jgi:hypothetical protein